MLSGMFGLRGAEGVADVVQDGRHGGIHRGGGAGSELLAGELGVDHGSHQSCEVARVVLPLLDQSRDLDAEQVDIVVKARTRREFQKLTGVSG
jgi:hypothetical protein